MASLISQIFFVIPFAQFQWHTVKGVLFFLLWVSVDGGFVTDCLQLPIVVVRVVVEFVVVAEKPGSRPELASADIGWGPGEFAGLYLPACLSAPEFASAIKKTDHRGPQSFS